MSQGLQVLLGDDSWFNVAPRPGSFIVNLGKMLAESTGWKVKATKHRVIETGGDRYSFPFFFEPGFSAMVPRSLPSCSDESSSEIQYIQYGPWLMENMKKYAEVGDLLKIAEEVNVN